jgi:hypothetical protein
VKDAMKGIREKHEIEFWFSLGDWALGCILLSAFCLGHRMGLGIAAGVVGVLGVIGCLRNPDL